MTLDLAIRRLGFPGGSVAKNPPASTGDRTQVQSLGQEDPPWRRKPTQRAGNPLQYSCLENPMDRGVWQAIDPGVAEKSDKTERLNNHQRLRIRWHSDHRSFQR